MQSIKTMLKSFFVTILSALLIIIGMISVLYINEEYYSEQAQYRRIHEVYKNLVAQTGQIQDRVPLYIIKNENKNAFTDGHKVVIYTGMIKYCKSIDEIALILGHEIAHNNLRHTTKLATNNVNILSELEGNADKLGAIYMMRAGYDICKGRLIYKRMLKDYGNFTGQTHPNFSYRYDELNINCQ